MTDRKDEGQKDAGARGTAGKDSSTRTAKDAKGTKEGELPEHHLVKEAEMNPPPPSNPDSWQGAEVATYVRGYEPPDPPISTYIGMTPEEVEAREKGVQLRKERDAEDEKRMAAQQEEADQKRAAGGRR